MKKILTVFGSFILCFILLAQPVCAAQLLVPGGQIIGLELTDDSVSVAAFDDTFGDHAKNAGIKIGDRITRVDQQTIHAPEDIRRALDRCDGTVQLELTREGKTRTLQITPRITPDGPRLGIYLKQGITGVGTVTWYDPDTGRFGALGHGVNDGSGQLLDMISGSVYEARVRAVKQGKIGKPGQLEGALTATAPMGTLYKNAAQGVFGKLNAPISAEPLPVADAAQVKTGAAHILSTVKDQQVQEYSVEILKIYPASRTAGRNMLLKITDPALLETTGGIVQGMSGSPIIQDGKLVGAVTHVLINDPTTGYGIFIENMLDAAA